MSDSLINRMDQRVLLKTESYIEFIIYVFALEVYSDCADGDWLLRGCEGKLYHKSEVEG